MTGDYTRFTHRPERRYGGVLMQQGRVQLDADWNEQTDITRRLLRLHALDTFGPAAVAWLNTPDAFLITPVAGPPPDFSIGAGRLYLDGLLAEAFEEEAPNYLSQPFYPDPPPLPGNGGVIVYLDLWEREVTYIEDPLLLEKALGGPDTTTRIQRVWQVKWATVDGTPECGVDLDAMFPPSAGRLTTSALAPPASDDPCIISPTGGYRGLENRLYRVEIQTPGPIGTAKFKWSRDNGSIVSKVEAITVSGTQTTLTVSRIGRDQVLRFRADDWVTVTDDHRELMGEPGEMARVIDTDEAALTITLDRAIPTGTGRAFGANATELQERHTRVQRWDQNATNSTIDADGLVDVAAGPIGLEDGVRVEFSVDPAGGEFHLGDHWVFAARTADASVETLTDAPPRGIEHHYLQLAVITGLGGAMEVEDCRPRPRDCACCCTVTVGMAGSQKGDYATLQEAVAALPAIAPDDEVHVTICLLPADHQVPGTVSIGRRRVRILGCGPASRLVVQQGPGLMIETDQTILEGFAMLAENEAPLIMMAGNAHRVLDLDLWNQGPGAAIRADRVADLSIEDCTIRASGGIDLRGDVIDVARNRIREGTLRIREESDTVRIVDNDLLGANGNAIEIGGRAPTYEIAIRRNRIRGALENGIVGGFIDVDGVASGIVMGLQIIGNEIIECLAGRRPEANAGLPLGGIVLGNVYDLQVHDNRIERNGEEAAAPVCGIYVRQSRGVEITRNLIRDNGRPPDSSLFQGPQAGICLAGASVMLEPDPDGKEQGTFRVSPIPAARIDGNTVESRRGPALLIRGMGPMMIRNNRLAALDILADLTDNVTDAVEAYVGAVFILNLGLPGYFAGWLSALGFGSLREGFAVLGQPTERFVVGGQVQFTDNQTRLDLTGRTVEVALANQLIFSLDDTAIADNQSEGVLRVDLLISDLFSFGLTSRVTGNGFMSTPLLTAFSILSLGWVNHCTNNQTTSCINAIGLSGKSFIGNNAVLWPHPQFCPEG